jgi:6-phosphogluconolactonase
MLVYIGSYTRGNDPNVPGIYQLSLDTVSGDLTLLSTCGGQQNPSFLAIDPAAEHLYSVSEVGGEDGGGHVAAYAIDQKDGGLILLNQQPVRGTSPCHLCVDQTDRCLIAVSYSSATIAAFPIDDDGRLQPRSDWIQHVGSSINRDRQEAAHTHSVNIDPNNRFAFVADLGTDQVFSYELDVANAKLRPNPRQPAIGVTPGAGPRHFCFHPDGRHAYLINELDSTIQAYVYDDRAGTLELLQTVPTLPVDFKGESTCAEVRVHPTGRFLYGSNRGHDSLAIYSIDENDGTLTARGQQATGGKTPRNFNIDPSGQWLIAANQDTNNLVVFRIDLSSGELQATGHEVEINAPVCVLFNERSIP